MTRETHQITKDETFDWVHAEHLLNFGDTVRRKSTGLTLYPDDIKQNALSPSDTWEVTQDDKDATDWQLITNV